LLRAGSKEVYSEDQGLQLLRNEKKMQQIEKRKEILYYSGQLQKDNIRSLPFLYLMSMHAHGVKFLQRNE
jgi:hypothetical protein